MMRYPSVSGLVRALIWLPLTSAYGQIAQDQAVLCGGVNQSIALPPGTNATTFVGGADLTIRLRDGSFKTVELDGPERIRQVCALGQDRLIVFGSVPGDDGYIIWILKTLDAGVVDIFGARNPVMSPDHHWLVFRRGYPTVVEVVFEEYLLYDLNKERSSNAPQTQGVPPGRMIYPVTSNHMPLDEVVVGDEQRHQFGSESFYWSPDSRFVVFADRLQAVLSLVVVDTASQGLPAFTRELTADDFCEAPLTEPDFFSTAIISGADFGSTREAMPTLWPHLSFPHPGPKPNVPCRKSPLVHAGNLQQARVEVHKALK
jgi:hypothetical protein